MQRAAFTIIELLVSVAIFFIVAAAATPAYQIFVKKNNAAEGTATVMTALANAESLSRAVSQDTGWGVAVQATSGIVFDGASLASSTPSLRQIFSLPAGIVVSGSSSFAFTKLYGMPQAAGNISLFVPGAGTTTVSVNAKGLISD